MHANKYKASLSRGGGDQVRGSGGKPELARIYFAGSARQDAGRGAAAHRGRSVRPGIRGRPKLWGRRGIIGGYWGGYNSLSSSPTPRALPGKVENLTPPANGKNGPAAALPDQQQTSTDDTSPERHAHHLRRRPGLFLFALDALDAGGLPDDAAPPAPCTTCAASMMTTTASSRPAPRTAPMMPPPCTACTRSPHQQRAPPALHQRAASSRPAARRAARACSICPACTTTTASRSAPPRPCKARRRRGQILHLTGYSFASRGKAKRLYTALSIPQPPFFPGLALGRAASTTTRRHRPRKPSAACPMRPTGRPGPL